MGQKPDDGAVTIRAIIAPLATAIRFDGKGDGGRVLVEFPESEVDEARKLLGLRMAPLKITFAYDDGK